MLQRWLTSSYYSQLHEKTQVYLHGVIDIHGKKASEVMYTAAHQNYYHSLTLKIIHGSDSNMNECLYRNTLGHLY